MAFLDRTGVVAFAHRGYDPGGAENTMRAFAQAVDLGYRYIETDIRVCADGVAIAFHDARLDRVTDRRGAVAALPWDTVQHARVRGTEPIPLLEDVLGAWPDLCVNLDVKSDDAIAATVAAIERTGSQDRVCVGAFSDRRVAAVQAAFDGAVCTSLGPRAAVSLRLASRVGRRVGRLRANCAQVPARLGAVQFTDARLVQTAHEAGLPVHAWTVNDPAEMRRLLDLGVDGVMTDRADVLRSILRDRGQWHD